ncbi:unnamed protein product, partial [Discosporangium mesarthrocarpum]
MATATGQGSAGTGDKEKGAGAVLFVIDTSGSMCVTTEVEGHLNLRGGWTRNLDHVRESGDAHNQRMPGQRPGITYISRLQSMQAAIDKQLETMSRECPERRVGLVTFNGEVTLVGDGSQEPRFIAGDRLGDPGALQEVGRSYPLTRPVLEARERLGTTVFGLEEGGPTALGPAAVAALSMLKERGGHGSRLVICTDGLANVGLGALDCLKTDQDRDRVEAFYRNLGLEASQHGVMVDVISMDSDLCDLENLGAMSDLSNGTVTKVKPADLAANFAGILATPVLATQVSVKVLLHKGLKFRNTTAPSTQASSAMSAPVGNILERMVGNVTAETELSFEYQVRPRAERQALGLPFDAP